MSPTSAKQQLPSNNNYRVLQCAILLMTARLGASLKLTPVQHPSRKLELDEESKSITIAFNEAKEFINNEDGALTESELNSLIQNRVIKRLHNTIERWNVIEDRLRTGISTTDQKQVSMFDDTLSVIAASRVMLGQLFWRSREDEVALKELEPSCPILWEYDIAKTSLDTDGWLDCYSTLGDIYVRMGRLEHAMELEKDLISRMPWLALTFSGKPTNSKFRTLATISHLTRLTREERRMISVYIKNAWKTGEALRARLNELVSEFILADTDKRRINVYIRTQHIIEEVLQRFVQDSNVSILHHSGKAMRELTKTLELDSIADNTTTYGFLDKTVDPTTAERDNALLIAETDSQTRKRESTLLNSALRVDLHREASFYLNTMDGIIEGGKHFLPAVRIREQEKVQDKFQSKTSSSTGRDGSSSSITAAPLGFQSRDQVMQIFEYLVAHQTERHEQAEAARLSASAARAARRAAAAATAASEPTKKSPPRQSRRPSQKQKRSEYSEGDEDNTVQPKRYYSFTGIFMALLAGSGFIIRSVSSNTKQQNNSNNTRPDRDSRAKYGPDSAKSDEGEKQPDNFLWLYIVATIGVSAASNLPPAAENACSWLASCIRKLLLALLAVAQQICTVTAPILSWVKMNMEILRREYNNVMLKREAVLMARDAQLTAWTSATSSPSSKQLSQASSSAKKSSINKALKATDASAIAPIKKQKSLTMTKKASKELKQQQPILHDDIELNHKKSKSKSGKSLKIAVPMKSEEVEHILLSIATSVSTDISIQDAINESPCITTEDSAAVSNINESPPLSPQTAKTSSPDLRCDTDINAPTLQLVKPEDGPSSPSSVADTGDNSPGEFLSEDKVFDDDYWRSLDEEEEGEGAWIETTAQQMRGKAKKLQSVVRSNMSASRQKQQPLQQQHDRKAAEAAFSSASMARDRQTCAALQARRGSLPRKLPAPAPTFCPTSSSAQSSSTPPIAASSISAPTSSRPAKEMSFAATAALKTILSGKGSPRACQAIHILTHIAAPSDFPPLPSSHGGHNRSQNSSVENSTDTEDHSSISGDSHQSSPRSRSLSMSADLLSLSEGDLTTQIPMQMNTGHMMQMPYYPLGFMPMHMPDMSQVVFDPVTGQALMMGAPFSPPIALTPEQQQSLAQHQSMIMMPFAPMYMMPHPQFDPMIQVPPMGGHMMNLADEHAMYNMHAGNQMYFDLMHSQAQQNVHHSHPTMLRSDVTETMASEEDIIESVRHQIEYYFSPNNLCRDAYLRSKMDCEGFVLLSEISNWNRIRKIGASPVMILQAVQSSTVIEIAEQRIVSAARGNKEETAALPSALVLSTLIRCAENPLSWVLQPDAQVAPEDYDTVSHSDLHSNSLDTTAASSSQ